MKVIRELKCTLPGLALPEPTTSDTIVLLSDFNACAGNEGHTWIDMIGKNIPDLSLTGDTDFL